MEIIETGNLGRIKTETTEDVVTAQLFTTIYGVGELSPMRTHITLLRGSTGPNTAYSWYSMGLRTLKDVEEQKFGIKLSGAQKVSNYPYLPFERCLSIPYGVAWSQVP
jgi:hypothetical protein